MPKKYINHYDAGHSWLEVEKEELEKLGIVQKISSYSYQNGSKVYLEEDCDMGTFLRAKGLEPNDAGRKWFSENILEVVDGDSSPIREYPRYLPDSSRP